MALSIQIQPEKKVEVISEWREYKNGAKFLVASVDRPAFQRAMELKNITIERQLVGVESISDNTPSNVVLFNKAAGRHLLLDWTGIDDGKGMPIPYSAETAEQLCTSSSESLELVNWIITQAQAIEKAHIAEKDDLVGKSLPSTNGKNKRVRATTKKTS